MKNPTDRFMHCHSCVQEIQAGTAGTNSPMEYARFSVGLSPANELVVWCTRHDLQIFTTGTDPRAQSFVSDFRAAYPDCPCCGVSAHVKVTPHAVN